MKLVVKLRKTRKIEKWSVSGILWSKITQTFISGSVQRFFFFETLHHFGHHKELKVMYNTKKFPKVTNK